MSSKTNKQLKEELEFMCKWLQIGERQRDYIWNWFEATMVLQCKDEREAAYEHSAIIRQREINEILKEVTEEAEDTYGNAPEVVRKWMVDNNCPIDEQ